MKTQTHFLQINDGFPELILQLMKISHSHFSEITRVIFIQVRTVMVLATGHTASTRMLAMLAHTAMAGGDMPATVGKRLARVEREMVVKG